MAGSRKDEASPSGEAALVLLVVRGVTGAGCFALQVIWLAQASAL